MPTTNYLVLSLSRLTLAYPHTHPLISLSLTLYLQLLSLCPPQNYCPSSLYPSPKSIKGIVLTLLLPEPEKSVEESLIFLPFFLREPKSKELVLRQR